MNVYLICLLWIFAMWLVTQFDRTRIVVGWRGHKKKINAFLVLSLFAAFLIMALRGADVGADTANYLRYFTDVSQLQWRGLFTGGWDNHYFTTEKGYMVLAKLLSLLTRTEQWILVVCAAIYIYCIYCFMKEYCRHTLTGVVTFLAIGSFLLAMNVMRQSVAVGLCLLAWLCIQKGSYKKAVFWILLACTFHTTSITMLLTILFKKLPASRKTIGIAAVATVLFSLGGSRLLYWIIGFFPTYAQRYGKGAWSISEANGMIVIWLVIAVVSIGLMFLVNWKNEENHFIFEVILCSMMYLGINVVGQSFDGFQRAAMFFQPFLILLFEEGGKCFERKTSRVYYAGVTVSMMLFFMRASSTEQYVYSFFW